MNTDFLNVPLKKRVSRASKALGVPEGEVVRRAVASYLDEFNDIASLFRELRMWDTLSASSMRRAGF